MKKKIKNWLNPLVFIGVLFMLTMSCKHNDKLVTVADIDGNVYHTVTIGNQVWMVENLKVTKYRNGDPIPNVTDSMAWSELETGAYCNNCNKPSKSAIYGRLYNWYAVNDKRNIAPSGWHVPSKAEWNELIDFLGGKEVAGDIMRNDDSTVWDKGVPQKEGSPNQKGFAAVLGGGRACSDGSFCLTGFDGSWWSSSKDDISGEYFSVALIMDLLTKQALLANRNFTAGESVRCIKDK